MPVTFRRHMSTCADDLSHAAAPSDVSALMDGGIEADNTGPRCRRPALAEFYLGTSAQPGAWRWGSGLGAPTREGTPKHATGDVCLPEPAPRLRVRLRGALACKAPSAPTPSATMRCSAPPPTFARCCASFGIETKRPRSSVALW